jgi:acetoin utilization deacetylase AcuC-like enzyme
LHDNGSMLIDERVQCWLDVPHSERPERLSRTYQLLERSGVIDALVRVPAREATVEELELVHPASLIESVRVASERGGLEWVGPEARTSAGTWTAALLAVGGLLEAVDRVAAGALENAFVCCRPPGHHASADQSMGFCLFNAVAVAARHIGGRVAIVDWDVHHGNGTQALVERDERIRYVSLHQHPWYPGTGMADERGVGNVFNVPRGPGAPPARYVDDLWAAIVAATSGWTADLVLVSAGFDAMLGDPLGGFTLEPEHYADLTRRLRERLPAAPIVGLLEGGYVPSRLADGVLAHALALV